MIKKGVAYLDSKWGFSWKSVQKLRSVLFCFDRKSWELQLGTQAQVDTEEGIKVVGYGMGILHILNVNLLEPKTKTLC